MTKQTYQFDDIEDLQRKLEIERDGVEVEIPGDRFLTLRAASDGNPLWKKQAESILNEMGRLRNAKASAERLREFLAEKYATLIIKSWRGVKIGGQEIEYNPELGLAFLLQAFDVYTIVDGFVWDTKNYRTQRARVIVDDAKNSSAG